MLTRRLVLGVFLGILSFQGAAADAAFDKMVNSLLRHSVPEIRTSELRAKKNIVLLDAREKNEYDVSHIGDAKWIGYKDFSQARLGGISKDAVIVVYCSVGYRSEKIAEQLRKNGYVKSYNYVGGIFDWVNSGGKVVDLNHRETQNIHGYNRTWGTWLKRGRVVY